jgi:hypothetical protein
MVKMYMKMRKLYIAITTCTLFVMVCINNNQSSKIIKNANAVTNTTNSIPNGNFEQLNAAINDMNRWTNVSWLDAYTFGDPNLTDSETQTVKPNSGNFFAIIDDLTSYDALSNNTSEDELARKYATSPKFNVGNATKIQFDYSKIYRNEYNLPDEGNFANRNKTFAIDMVFKDANNIEQSIRIFEDIGNKEEFTTLMKSYGFQKFRPWHTVDLTIPTELQNKEVSLRIATQKMNFDAFFVDNFRLN